jgi:hypothetical protein
MKDAHDAALEQGPDILNPIHMDFALHIGFRVIHGLMRKLGTV